MTLHLCTSHLALSTTYVCVGSQHIFIWLVAAARIQHKMDNIKQITFISVCNKYTECPRRNVPNFGRVFLMLNYTDITQNTYIQSWTVTEVMAIEKCGLLGYPRTVSRLWRHTHPLRMPGNEKPLANIGIQWPWRDKGQDVCARMSLTSSYRPACVICVCRLSCFLATPSYCSSVKLVNTDVTKYKLCSIRTVYSSRQTSYVYVSIIVMVKPNHIKDKAK